MFKNYTENAKGKHEKKCRKMTNETPHKLVQSLNLERK